MSIERTVNSQEVDTVFDDLCWLNVMKTKEKFLQDIGTLLDAILPSEVKIQGIIIAWWSSATGNDPYQN